jgi:hypothetical protein
MVVLSTYEQSWEKLIFCVVNTVIFSALNFDLLLSSIEIYGLRLMAHQWTTSSSFFAPWTEDEDAH